MGVPLKKKRRFLLENIISLRFHVEFQGCTSLRTWEGSQLNTSFAGRGCSDWSGDGWEQRVFEGLLSWLFKASPLTFSRNKALTRGVNHYFLPFSGLLSHSIYFLVAPQRKKRKGKGGKEKEREGRKKDRKKEKKERKEGKKRQKRTKGRKKDR